MHVMLDHIINRTLQHTTIWYNHEAPNDGEFSGFYSTCFIQVGAIVVYVSSCRPRGLKLCYQKPGREVQLGPETS